RADNEQNRPGGARTVVRWSGAQTTRLQPARAALPRRFSDARGQAPDTFTPQGCHQIGARFVVGLSPARWTADGEWRAAVYARCVGCDLTGTFPAGDGHLLAYRLCATSGFTQK